MNELNAIPITHMRVDELVSMFQENEQEVLRLIDEDPLLRKREHPDGLVIANASKGLFEPTMEHQVFAKGIVYTRNPYRLVAMPLMKMHNYDMNAALMQTISEVRSNELDVHVEFNHKEDGTFVQVFEHNGKVYFATRSVIEGCEVANGAHCRNFDYIGTARRILEEQWSFALGLVCEEPVSLFFELIHPECRVISDYEDMETMVLIGGFDKAHAGYRYFSNADLMYFEMDGANIPSHFANNDPSKMESVLFATLSQLNDMPALPEGLVVSLVQNQQLVLCRFKVKTSAYIDAHRLKYAHSYKSVVKMLWNHEELRAWDVFLRHLKGRGHVDEEIQAVYRKHFDTFSSWMTGLRQSLQDCRLEVDAIQRRYVKDGSHSWNRNNEIRKIIGKDYKNHPCQGLMFKVVSDRANVVAAAKHDPPYKGFANDLRTGVLTATVCSQDQV